jgi:hypothetical protein
MPIRNLDLRSLGSPLNAARSATERCQVAKKVECSDLASSRSARPVVCLCVAEGSVGSFRFAMVRFHHDFRSAAGGGSTA